MFFVNFIYERIIYMGEEVDTKTLEAVQEVTKKEGKSKTKSNIMHFLIDYNVISNAIAFITAIEIRLLVSETFESIGNNYLGLKNHVLLRRLITVIAIIISCYFFIKYIYYPFLYTPNIAKENILKKAIVKKKIDDTAKKLETLE
jgi:hypothetical protein